MDPPVIPNGVQDRLVSIHAKLLQLVEGIAELERQIEYGGNQGMLPWSVHSSRAATVAHIASQAGHPSQILSLYLVYTLRL